MVDFLVEIKKEFIEQLSELLCEHIYEGFQSLYLNSKNMTTSNEKLVLSNFQSNIDNIKNLSENKIKIEYNRVYSKIKIGEDCDIELILTGVVKSYLSVLLFTNKNADDLISEYLNDIKPEVFVHKIYKSASKYFWNNPYLFYDKYPTIELKKNYNYCIKIIKKCIKSTVRTYVMDDIIYKEYNFSNRCNKMKILMNILDETNKLENKMEQIKEESNQITNNSDVISLISNIKFEDFGANKISKSNNNDDVENPVENRPDESDEKEPVENGQDESDEKELVENGPDESDEKESVEEPVENSKNKQREEKRSVENEQMDGSAMKNTNNTNYDKLIERLKNMNENEINVVIEKIDEIDEEYNSITESNYYEIFSILPY